MPGNMHLSQTVIEASARSTCDYNVPLCLFVEYVSTGGGTRGLGYRQ